MNLSIKFYQTGLYLQKFHNFIGFDYSFPTSQKNTSVILIIVYTYTHILENTILDLNPRTQNIIQTFIHGL